LIVNSGVIRDPVHPEMYFIDGVVESVVFMLTGERAVMTSSVRPPTPGGSSLHPLGLARDYRTKYFIPSMQREIADKVREILDSRFDVVLEGPASPSPKYRDRVAHLHVELDVQ